MAITNAKIQTNTENEHNQYCQEVFTAMAEDNQLVNVQNNLSKIAETHAKQIDIPFIFLSMLKYFGLLQYWPWSKTHPKALKKSGLVPPNFLKSLAYI